MPDFNDQYKEINKNAYAEVQENFSLLAKLSMNSTL